MSRSLRSILILPVLILLVGMACNLSTNPTPSISVPTTTHLQEQPVEQPTKENFQTAEPELKPDHITISVTDLQMTAHIVENMPKEIGSTLSNPVIRFKPGQVELLATIKGDIISAEGRVVLSVTIDQNGKPITEILQANFGPFPIPSGLVANLSTAVDDAITDSMKEHQSEYRLESITFTTGVATIVLAKK